MIRKILVALVLGTSSLIAAAADLAVTSTALPSATRDTAYAATLTASGGTPAYTWSILSGALPAGLTLDATTGLISGTPSTSATSHVTVLVTDNGRPARTASSTLTLSVSAAAVDAANANAGTTWYIRADGGTRYTANAPLGQCDGKADAAYGGSGVNQHCAFNDYRFLWDDQHTYGVTKWVIAGGDTVILDNTKQWRVGFDQGLTPNDAWCYGGSGTFGCSNPTVPSGNPGRHTRILGRNYATCNTGNVSDRSRMTQVFGGYGVYSPMNLSGAQFVDVECLEITRHSQCTIHGSPAYPALCNRSGPIDDFDSDGITTSNTTHDLLLQDLWIHGHTDRGIIGAIGGTVTATRVDIAYNAMAGWDFDDGSATPSINGVWNFNYSTIEWSGCNQQYPITSTYPAISCYSQSTGGYGDGVGTPAGTGITANIDHSIFRYNTQDGLDLGHVDTGAHTLTITNSTAYANNGGQFKWGPNMLSANLFNNLVLSNCLRMSQPISGAPSTYNQNLADFCRAEDAISFNFRQGGNAILANNTVVSYSPTTFDINCVDTTCTNSTFLFANNIVRGYANPSTYDLGGQEGGVGNLYYQAPIGHVVRKNNLFYGIRGSCPATGSNEFCADPLFVDEPVFTNEASLDNFNFNLSSSSPARGAGVVLNIAALLKDNIGTVRAVPPSLGALEYGDSTTTTPPAPSNPTTLVATTTKLKTDVVIAGRGKALEITATVTAADGSIPSGTVTFVSGSTTLGVGTLNSYGATTIVATTLLSIPSDLAADYQGSSTLAPSSSN